MVRIPILWPDAEQRPRREPATLVELAAQRAGNRELGDILPRGTLAHTVEIPRQISD